MIEAVWALLFVFAYRDRRNRFLADVLVAKWVLNYFAFLFVSEQAPIIVDIVFGTIGVYLSAGVKPLVAWLFVATVLIRASYWSLWDIGVWLPLPYYYALLGIFTAQVLLICPWRGAWNVVAGLARNALAFRPLLRFKGQAASGRTSAVHRG